MIFKFKKRFKEVLIKYPFIYKLVLKIKYTLKFLITKIFKFGGYEINIQISKIICNSNNELNNLNIGAGNYIIPNFKSLDFYSPHYYKNKEEFLKKRIDYDIRKNNIPFDDFTVDNIYISHVIEHLENKYVENFLEESFRVLKKGSVLRIACPDAKFLYNVSKFSNSYWEWRKGWFESRGLNWNKIKKEDCFIRELSTPKLSCYEKHVTNFIKDSSSIFEDDYQKIISLLKKDLYFRFNNPGDHINCWDFKQLYELGSKVGFKHIIESKYRGSVSSIMQSQYFDQTSPNMSLYVDMVK